MSLITGDIVWNKNRYFTEIKEETVGTHKDLILSYEAVDIESQHFWD